ncbi:MAG TPA: TMEM175 family protein [Kofleriaceae bacterium]|nr:TMEM175 family protein [Kofleriaceae bacterium]
MTKGRLEAFSDGVLAIIITIMVLELKTPHETDLAALRPLVPILLTYLLSFVFVAIYWNNHHNMLHAVERVTGGVLWANLHLLFWLSLFPFVTGWMDENHFEPVPVAAFGCVLLGSAIAYYILTRALLANHAADSMLARGLGRDVKGKLSTAGYVAAIPLAFVHPAIALAMYVSVALVWLVPDRRFERLLAEAERPSGYRRPEQPS